MYARIGWALAATLLLGASGIVSAGELTDRTLREGISGTDVVALQDHLREAGFNPGPIDGKFGPRTEQAVRKFQASKGLLVDGVVGPETIAALDGPASTESSSTPSSGSGDGGLPALEKKEGRLKGVDVSKYEANIDWARVAASGISFGIARVSDGLTTHDAYFAKNWAGMQANGIVRGAYQFFRASQDPVKQADYFVGKVGTFDLPPFLDLETKDGVSTATVVTRMKEWIAEVKAKTGMTPMIYVTRSFWEELGNPPTEGCGLWVANWGVTTPKIPSGWTDWTFWQYSATGSVPGIEGDGVDLDYFGGTKDDLQKLAQSGKPAVAATPTAGSSPAPSPDTEVAAVAAPATVGFLGVVDTSTGTGPAPTLAPADNASPSPAGSLQLPALGDSP